MLIKNVFVLDSKFYARIHFLTLTLTRKTISSLVGDETFMTNYEEFKDPFPF